MGERREAARHWALVVALERAQDRLTAAVLTNKGGDVIAHRHAERLAARDRLLSALAAEPARGAVQPDHQVVAEDLTAYYTNAARAAGADAALREAVEAIVEWRDAYIAANRERAETARETATLTERLATREAECDAWRKLAHREVPERMTPEQFAFMQESTSEDSTLLDEAERRAWLIEPRVGGGWEISEDAPTGGGDADVVVLACTRESLRDSLRVSLRAAAGGGENG